VPAISARIDEITRAEAMGELKTPLLTMADLNYTSRFFKRVPFDWFVLVWIPLSWLFKLSLPDHVAVIVSVFIATMFSYRLPEIRALYPFGIWIVKCLVISLIIGLFTYLVLLQFR
jgi:hypothetical protein